MKGEERMNKLRKLTIIFSLITAVLCFIGLALINTNMIIGFVILALAIVPAYIAHVFSRLEEDERRY